MENEENVTTSYELTPTIRSNKYDLHLPQTVWYILVIVSGLCILTTLYLFACVLLFLKRKSYIQLENRGRGINRPTLTNNGLSRGTPASPINGPSFGFNYVEISLNRSKLSVKTRQRHNCQAASSMHAVLLVTLGINLLRGLVEQLLFFLGGNSDHACNTLTKIMIGLTGFAIHGCLVFLWLRQYVFYINPLLRKIRPKSLKLISYSTYAEMVVTVLGCLVLHVWWRDFISLDGICRSAIGTRRLPVFIPYGILAVSTVTIQISLTFLFVYPIVRHHRQMKISKENNPNALEDPQTNSRSTKRLIKCVKRALLAATVSITTDIAGAFIAIWLPEGMPIFALSVLYGIDVNLNIFCLFYTYVYWRDIVFPWRVNIKVIK